MIAGIIWAHFVPQSGTKPGFAGLRSRSGPVPAGRGGFAPLQSLALFFALFTGLSVPLVWSQSAGISGYAYTLDQILSLLNSTPGLNGRIEFRWDPFLSGGNFSLGDHHGSFASARFSGEDGYFMLDGSEVFRTAMPWLEAGLLLFPEPFVQTVSDAFARAFEEDKTRMRIAAIMIDPGHGGKDPGAVGNVKVNGKPLKVVEKDVVLASSKHLKTLLEKTYPGKQILMTRESDIFLSLEQRTAKANAIPLKNNEAIIYVSIHANSNHSSAARGYEVYYLNPNVRRDVIDRKKYADSADNIYYNVFNDLLQEEYTRESIRIAESILESLKQTMGRSMPSRGIKSDEWFVVRNSHMPAVLVELAFVSNVEDARLLTGEAGLQKLTEAVYKGIVDFVSDFERSGGFIATK